MSDESLRSIFNLVAEAIEQLPNPPRKGIQKEVRKMEEVIMDNRAPRILILGRRGAGKSSLINAFFGEKVAETGSVVSETGEAKWHSFENSKGSIDILDTRGLGDRTKPEAAHFEEAVGDIKGAIENHRPDAILFLCKAKEVDARITEDIESVAKIREYILDIHAFDIPVAAVVTQVDELDPKRIEPPYEDPQKQENIAQAVRVLENAFGSIETIPVSAYAEHDQSGAITYDNYWSIDILLDYLMDVLPHSAQLQLARLSALKTIQKRLARVVVGSAASVCAGFAATPIPLADAIPITTVQMAMITGIGYIAGKEISREHAKKFVVALGANVGAAFALREGARALIKLMLPVGGYLISAGVAFAGTWGIGEAAIAYFVDELSIEEAKDRFKKVKRETREDYEDSSGSPQCEG